MPKNPDIRWLQRFTSFQQALAVLIDATNLAQSRALSDLEKQGLIQAFEFTHELAWKTLKDFLEERGTANLYGSKDATREAFSTGLIKDGEAWMEMIQSRNRTTHTYNRQTADQIARAIVAVYAPQFQNFESHFLALKSSLP